jgi:hypothetical protein
MYLLFFLDEKHNSTPGLSEKEHSGIAPRGRVKHTFHSCTPKKTGSESIRHQIEIKDLKQKIIVLEKTHKESVKKKEKVTDSSITTLLCVNGVVEGAGRD